MNQKYFCILPVKNNTTFRRMWRSILMPDVTWSTQSCPLVIGSPGRHCDNHEQSCVNNSSHFQIAPTGNYQSRVIWLWNEIHTRTWNELLTSWWICHGCWSSAVYCMHIHISQRILMCFSVFAQAEESDPTIGRGMGEGRWRPSIIFFISYKGSTPEAFNTTLTFSICKLETR